MSNKENPCAGYVIEVSKLKVFLSEEQRPAFDDALEDHDFDKARKLLEEAIPAGVACPTELFVLGDTDTGDGDLDQDVVYACFDEDDLFEKREKPDLIRLRDRIGAAPALHSWTIWG